MNTLISISNVSRLYQQGDTTVHALNNVSLRFTKGEFTALFGPSGSGKTTLLNLIGGLDLPTSGTIEVDGVVLNTLTHAERSEFRLSHIGFIFQSFNLIPVLTAQENVEFVMHLQGESRAERSARACEVLEQVGLFALKDRRPDQMSGGQQQRVAVARAIASKPQLVLADEPTANLDSTTSYELLTLMEDLNQSLGITFLFSTHDAQVMERATRLVQLQDGTIIDDTTKPHSTESPQLSP